MLSRARHFQQVFRSGLVYRPNLNQSCLFAQSQRFFSGNVSPAPRIHEAVKEFIELRKSELQQYEAVDSSDKAETEKLIELLSGAKVDAATTWSSLGLDGLDEVELVLAIEEALGITLPDEEFHKVRSVSDAVEVFSKYTPKQG